MTISDKTEEPALRAVRAGQPIPGFYDDLDATLAEVWRLLSRGVADRRSPFHTPAVATVAADGAPSVRTVVLRGVDPMLRAIRFHTDIRSRKFGEIASQPRVALLGYDPGHKIQLRLAGYATAHTGPADQAAVAAWAATRDRSRVCYMQAVAPGEAMPAGAVAEPALADGFQNFVAVTVEVDEIEWLYLAHPGHRRARFAWPGGRLEATWLAP